jgi:hypothetical protein
MASKVHNLGQNSHNQSISIMSCYTSKIILKN